MICLTTASYHCTGSSAVTDFFSEFSSVHSAGSKEFRFPQELDGLADLEYYIVENNHRFNSSQEIKRFIKLSKRLNGILFLRNYEKDFHNRFLEVTNEYLKSIIQLSCKTMCTQDRLNYGKLFHLVDIVYSIVLNKLLPKNILKTSRRYSLIKPFTYGYYTCIDQESFLKQTKQYTDKLLSIINDDNKPFVLLDQLVPPSNTSRYSRYFSNIKIFVVERDPRDIFIQESVAKWGTVPSDVRDFCKWYIITRNHRKLESFSQNALFVHFEDLIYKYEETASLLTSFAGLDPSDHIFKKKYLNPDVSIKNTRLFSRYPQFSSQIAIIEEMLPEYLYKY